MKTVQKEFPLGCVSPLVLEYFKEGTIFFDIETTGFSPKSSQLYLIGCAGRQSGTVLVAQFFAEKKSEEQFILSAFFTLVDQCHSRVLVNYNGTGFDLPYLFAKSEQYGMENVLFRLQNLDLYKQAYPYKHIFHLENLKQKSLENFLQIHRQDSFNGGELIGVYEEYCSLPTAENLTLLLQHNYDDVRGMVQLLPILSYVRFFRGDFQVKGMEQNEYADRNGLPQKELYFRIAPAFALPMGISYFKEDFYLSGEDCELMLRVKIHSTELKYFYDNYKDYYFLPEEDMAIHKSVGVFVDKDFRQKAKAGTCYSKKNGDYLLQPEPIKSPSFRYQYKAKDAYFELKEETFNDNQFQLEYCRMVIHYLVTSPPR